MSGNTPVNNGKLGEPRQNVLADFLMATVSDRRGPLPARVAHAIQLVGDAPSFGALVPCRRPVSVRCGTGGAKHTQHVLGSILISCAQSGLPVPVEIAENGTRDWTNISEICHFPPMGHQKQPIELLKEHSPGLVNGTQD